MRFSLRLQKLALFAGTLLCAGGTFAVFQWAVLPLPSVEPNQRSTAKQSKVTTEPAEAKHFEPKREDFAKLWDRPLRRPLYDPPPPKPVVRELPPLRVEVLGTILEPENSMAIVRGEQGQVEYKRVGDAIGPLDSPGNVVEIGAEGIVVERAEQRVTLGVRNRERR